MIIIKKSIVKSLRCDENLIIEIENNFKVDGSKNFNEYVEKAIRYYTASLYVSDKEDVLSEMFFKVLNGRLGVTEDRIAKLLFKNSVEIAKLSKVLGHISKLDEETLNTLHKKSVEYVKSTNGKINFEEIYKYQKGLM